MEPAGASVEEIQQRAAELVQAFPLLWRTLVDEWARPGAEPRAWLMYSASYLVRTSPVRWAIDPVRLKHRLPAAPAIAYEADLAPLSFVLLTHQHGDHFDLNLMHSLRNQPITWVVPVALVRRVIDEAGIPANQIIVPELLKPIKFPGLVITPFSGMHWEAWPEGPGVTRRGVPAIGYLVEHGGKRWLFPGDTRTYDARTLPLFGPVDVLFAHLWLGRAAAQIEPPPLLESFCRWCTDLASRRIVLTHLEEFGRGPNDFWNSGHAARVVSRLIRLRPTIEVVAPAIGQSVSL